MTKATTTTTAAGAAIDKARTRTAAAEAARVSEGLLRALGARGRGLDNSRAYGLSLLGVVEEVAAEAGACGKRTPGVHAEIVRLGGRAREEDVAGSVFDADLPVKRLASRRVASVSLCSALGEWCIDIYFCDESTARACAVSGLLRSRPVLRVTFNWLSRPCVGHCSSAPLALILSVWQAAWTRG